MVALSVLAPARTLIVTGKGGAGKTTVSAVLASLGAREGRHVRIVQIVPPTMRHEDGAQVATPPSGHLQFLFGTDEPITYDPVVLRQDAGGGQVSGRSLAPDTALIEYLNVHGMRRLSRRLVASGALDVVATAVPGMPDMLVLGKVKQMEKALAPKVPGGRDAPAPDGPPGPPGPPGLIVLDAPAAGHAIRFLQGPRAILDAAGGGPIRAQAQEVVEMLSDPARCQVVLVTTAEETPVSETIETAQLITERSGAQVAAIIVNARLPVLSLPAGMGLAELAALSEAAGAKLSDEEIEALVTAGDLRSRRQEAQAVQVARLAQELAVPQLELPFCFSSELGPVQLEALTDALEHSVIAAVPAPRAPHHD